MFHDLDHAHPQLSRTQSAGVLRMLHEHIETPEFQCRFRWRVQRPTPRYVAVICSSARSAAGVPSNTMVP